jgi:hypothetical protein
LTPRCHERFEPLRAERLFGFEVSISRFCAPEAQVRVLVRALLGPMSELSLHRRDRLAAGDGLARDRVPLVAAEQPEPELLL